MSYGLSSHPSSLPSAPPPLPCLSPAVDAGAALHLSFHQYLLILGDSPPSGWLTMVFVLSFLLVQAKIVRQESLNIDAQYEKKHKQAEIGLKMYVQHLCGLCSSWNRPLQTSD